MTCDAEPLLLEKVANRVVGTVLLISELGI